MSKNLIILAVLGALMGSGAHATVPTQPIEHFTRSLSAFYVVLQKCDNSDSNLPMLEASRKSLYTYVSSMYPFGVPYWALPKEEQNIINDPETCNYLIYDRMASYETARRAFVAAYPNEVTPPQFKLPTRQDNGAFEFVKRPANKPKLQKWHPEYEW